jgi:hypothetical protein
VAGPPQNNPPPARNSNYAVADGQWHHFGERSGL